MSTARAVTTAIASTKANAGATSIPIPIPIPAPAPTTPSPCRLLSAPARPSRRAFDTPPAVLRRASLPQQLQLPDRGLAPRGADRAGGGAGLQRPGDHRRVLARRRGARARRGAGAKA